MSQAHNYNVFIIILCSLYDRLTLHVALNCIFLFEVTPIIFQAIQNHRGEQCASEVSQMKEIIHYLSALMYGPNFLMGPITITLKMNIYQPIPIWRPIYHASLQLTYATPTPYTYQSNRSNFPLFI